LLLGWETDGSGPRYLLSLRRTGWAFFCCIERLCELLTVTYRPVTALRWKAPLTRYIPPPRLWNEPRLLLSTAASWIKSTIRSVRTGPRRDGCSSHQRCPQAPRSRAASTTRMCEQDPAARRSTPPSQWAATTPSALESIVPTQIASGR